MNKKIISLLLGVMLLMSTPFTCFAADVTTDLSPKVVEVNPTREVRFQTFWKITSSTLAKNDFGAWRVGPTGKGPGNLDINDSTTISRSFTTSISGDYPVSIGSIGANLGVSIGKSYTHGTRYSITLEDSKKKTIIYRPKIQVYRITQTQYRADNYTGKMTKLKTATAYVNVFLGWDYSWRNGY